MSWLKRALLWLMSLFYVFAGVMHLVRPEYYQPMMPPYLPAHDFLIWLSGVGELALGILVVDAKVRRFAAWGLIALLIAIFPANIHIALNNIPVFGAAEGAGLFNWVRLPFQAVFILWAWWYTRPDEEEKPAVAPRPAEDEIWIAKPEILRRMDVLSRKPAVVEAALHAIESRPEASLLELGVEYGYVDKRPEEHDHLARDWFDTSQGWWRSLPAIEPALRAAFIRAGHLALEHNLPVDSYWIRGGERFEVAMGKTDRAIVLLFLSPFPPVAGKRVSRDFADLWLFGSGGVERIGSLIGRT
jgi:uncharacterized membrane protein